MIAMLLAGLASPPAHALEIVIDDVASDRVERQRRYARGEMPLAGTPDLARLNERLTSRGLEKGRAIYIRIFKAESELEVWMQNRSGTFTLLDTYPICHWTGTLGPKLKEGDKQSPEGFYSVGMRQMRLVGRWRRAFNLGFPNQHDQLLSRTGSYILVHGGCSSVGCFAMTDQVQDEIYRLADAALSGGQGRFQVHVFPFRMTAANMASHADHEWAHTWADLKPAYDSFERTRVPPVVALCGPRYRIADGLPGETGGTEARLAVLKPSVGEALGFDPSQVLDASGRWLEPQCRLEDEDKRAAANRPSTGPDMAGNVIQTSVSLAASERKAEAQPTAGETRPDASRSRRLAVPARSAKRADEPAVGAQTEGSRVPEGFGSATFNKGKERVTAQGG